MAHPQQPELARSARTDLDPDHVETGLQGQPTPATGGETGAIPPENQPGHHPEKEQDKPDLDAFAARLGTDPQAPAKAAPAKAAPVKAAAAKAAPRKAAPPKPAPRKTAPTPAKLPASAPTPDAVGMSAPQPKPEREQPAPGEPRLVGLVLLPLRETVKRLEQLDRALTERLARQRQSARGGLGPRSR